MRFAIFTLALLTGVVAQPFVTTIDVASCADLVAAAEATSGGDILGQLTEEFVTCDDWTTIEVKTNKLKLVGGLPRYTLKRVRFAVASDAVLRVEVPGAIEFAASFQGDDSQEVSGGFLNVAAGGRARFFAGIFMYGVGVKSVSEDSKAHGGCIYNEGTIRFEGGFTAGGCTTTASDPYISPGNGGGVWNGPDGKLVFKSFTSFEANGGRYERGDAKCTIAIPTEFPNGNLGTTSVDGGLDGGGLYNEGAVSFFEDAEFIDNHGGFGGGLYNAASGVVKFLKRSKPSFTESTARCSGGHVYNEGSLVLRNTGYFAEGYSHGSGGAIDSMGTMQFFKHVDFIDNTAGAHGGAIASDYGLIEYIPEDATYSGNSRTQDAIDNDFWCDDVYLNGSPDGGEDGYVCIPGFFNDYTS